MAMSARERCVAGLLAVTATLLLGAWPCAAQDAGGAQQPPPDPPPTATAPDPPPAPTAPDPPPAPTPQEPTPVATTGQVDTPAIGFRVGGFDFKPSGRVKLDVIRDFDPIGSTDYFDTRTIFVDGSRGTNSNLHAKETRLNLDIRGIVQERELRLFIETDFYGTNTALRLRHAYGTWGGLLAGQTWTTFMDEDNLPRTIDFEAPTAFAQIRQAVVRWTQDVGSGITLAVAVEDNKSEIILPTNVPGNAEYPMPDVVARMRWYFGSGHIQTAAFTGWARFRPTDQSLPPDTVNLWGGMLSANFGTFGKDTIYGVVTAGEGIGRYRGGITAVPDANGFLHPAAVVAFMGGYEHFWTSRWSTNAVYSIGVAKDEDFYTDLVNRRLEYGAINLLYWFLGDRAWTGVEYLYGYRQVYGEGLPTGVAHRVQYAVRFNLP
jgi:hypothetical protein